LISEAGCPAVADPGADLVRLAHRRGIRVVPLVGPSSILLALMASGLGGQRFVFHGYLPVDADEQAKKIVQIEKESRARDETQIFIETPYRNMKLFESLLQHCREHTLLCIATDVTLATEFIATKPMDSWRKTPPRIGKRPTVFLIKA
jgi:16S rRNA (cytidine1402-2'-O)-methyltransferase